MEVGVHLPQLAVLDSRLSSRRIAETVAAARSCGAVALSANDHFAFSRPERIRRLVAEAGFGLCRTAAETPFNRVLEIRR